MPQRELLESNNLEDRPQIRHDALGVVYRAGFLVFLVSWKADFWCPEPSVRMYLGYDNLFPKSLPFSFTDPLPKSLPSCSFPFLICIWTVLLGSAARLVLVCGPCQCSRTAFGF